MLQVQNHAIAEEAQRRGKNNKGREVEEGGRRRRMDPWSANPRLRARRMGGNC
jgi:hypothetical protein